MFKNLLNTLRRFKLASSLNIIGLGIAYAAFIIIMIQVLFEFNFGKNDHDYDQIFRLETPDIFAQNQWSQLVNPKTLDYFEQQEPKVKAVLKSGDDADVFYSVADSIKGTMPAKYMATTCRPDTVFHFTFKEGSFAGFESGDNAVIPVSVASKLYPNSSAVGKDIFISGQYLYAETKDNKQLMLRIIGVYEDFPENSIFKSYIFTKDMESNFRQNFRPVFIKTNKSDTAAIMANYRRWLTQNKTNEWNSPEKLRLTAAQDIYYMDDVRSDDDAYIGNRSTTNMLLIIAIVVILIASINYVNFSTALAPMRVRGLNTRSVFGETKSSIRCYLVSEALVISLVAYLVSLLLVTLFADTSYADLIKTPSMKLTDNIPVVGLSFMLAVAVGIIAGVYPAYFSTKFDTAMVLKSSGASSANGQKLRIALTCIQYVVSMMLIIGSIFIAIQNHYLRSFALGFNKDNIYTFGVYQTSYNQRQTIAQKLKQNPRITEVAFAMGKLGVKVNSISKVGFQNDTISIQSFAIDENFLRLMRISVVQGRDFNESDNIMSDEEKTRGGLVMSGGIGIYQKWIFTAKARDRYGIRLDSTIDGRGKASGFIDNIYTEALYNEPKPMYFSFAPGLTNRAYVRISSEDVPQTLAYIKGIYDELNSRYDYDGEFLGAAIEAQYKKEVDLGKLITLFSMLAIIISLVGVFGLVVFETQYRRREIGLRKINGATSNTILGMLNRKLLIITGFCFIVTLPIAWYGVNEWLSSFAYRTSIHWWVFGLALLIVLIITVATVTIQSWRVANENPINSIKTE